MTKKTGDEFLQDLEEEGLVSEFDFGTVDTVTYNPEDSLIPRGWYMATVREVKIGTAASSGYATRTFRFEIDDLTAGDQNGRSVFHTLSASPGARGMMMDAVGALYPEGYRGDMNPDHFVGRACRIKVDIEPAKGEYSARNRIKGLKAAGASVPVV